MHTVYPHQRNLMFRNLLRRVSGALAGILLVAALFHLASMNARVEAQAEVKSRPAPAPTSTAVVVDSSTRVAAATATPSAQAVAKPSVVEADSQSPADRLCERPTGQLITETVPSKIASVPMYAHVFLPPCYSSQRKYPVLYLIHGTAIEFGGWVADGMPRLAEIRMSLGTLPPFIIVMPSADMRAGTAGRYAWSNGGKNSYGEYVVSELLPFIDGKYSTLPTREGRAIGGISRGGYWSIQIALSNSDKFGTLGAHSPSITTKLVGVPAGFTMLSFLKSVDDMRRMRVWMDAGDADWARFDIDKFAKDLKASGIDGFQYSVGRGEHADDYWSSRVSEYLTFYASGWAR